MEKTKKARLDWSDPEDDELIRQLERVQEEFASAFHQAYHRPHTVGATHEWSTPPRPTLPLSSEQRPDWEPIRVGKSEPEMRVERGRIRSRTSLFLGGERGDRILVISQADDDTSLAVRRRLAGMFMDLPTVRSLRVHESGGVLNVYAIVDSWEFQDLRPIYERELQLREEFPEFPLELKAVLTEEEDRVPSEANLLMKR